MRTPWNKGLRKDSHASVQKISATMKARKLDNFKNWRDQMKKSGIIKSSYDPFTRNEKLAELIGVVLGNGNIGVFPRSECLRIVGNSNNQGFIDRYARIVEQVFGKRPYVAKRKYSNATDITIYENNISSRLEIPVRNREGLLLPIPAWITGERKYLIAYLRGLYEAEGSYSQHLPTYTHKFLFSNKNQSLLDNVFESLVSLGFHPHRSLDKIQISKKEEVQKLINLLQFRRY